MVFPRSVNCAGWMVQRTERQSEVLGMQTMAVVSDPQVLGGVFVALKD